MGLYYIPIKEEPPTCPFNDGVVCSGNGPCHHCGWNPPVAKDRLDRICKKLGIQVPESQEPEKEEQADSEC